MLKVFKKLLKSLSYIYNCVKYNLLSSFSNKTSFILQSSLMFLNNFVWLIVWIVLFNKSGNNINGVTMNDILYLWSIPVIGFAISLTCFGGTEYLSQNITTGKLDVYLVQPQNSLIGLITSHCRISAFGDLIYGLIIGLFAVNFNIFNYVFLIILSILSSIVFTCVITIINLLTFWLGDLSRFSNIYTYSLFLTLTIYPDKMFNNFTKLLMYTVIPAFYCAHLPVRISQTFNIVSFLIFIFSIILIVIMTNIIYIKGLKRYESGNLFNTK